MNHKVLREPSEISRGRSHCISDKARRKNHTVNCVQHLMLGQTRVDRGSPNVPSSHSPMFEDPSPLTVMVQLLVVCSNKPCEVTETVTSRPPIGAVEVPQFTGFKFVTETSRCSEVYA